MHRMQRSCTRADNHQGSEEFGAVKEMILSEKKDFRVCTACSGPALVPITIKAPKSSDVKIPIGDNILYISAVQASYIKKVTIDMRYDSDKIFACSALNYFR